MLSRMLLVIRCQLLFAMMRLRRWIPAFLGLGVREVEGETVSGSLRWFLRLVAVEPVKSTPEKKRAIYDYISDSYLSGAVLDVDVVNSYTDGDHPLPVRIYRPPGKEGLLPSVLWLHGGGYVMGSLRSHDRFCRRLCQDAGTVVIALEYRLAPEHPYPQAHDDVATAYRWIRENAESLQIDRERIAVGGDSAGGGLTAVLCQSLPLAQRPRLQVLCYPATDLSKAWPSYDDWADGYFLNRRLMRWFLNHYCPPERRHDPRASPLLAESLEGQPDALLITAGMDPLADEGRAYGDKLESAGVPVERVHLAPMLHGFITLTGVFPAADDCVGEFLRRIGRRLRGDKTKSV
jgi:acetyl esterase